MTPTKVRKQYTSKKDLMEASPEELTSLLLEKGGTNPDGWTAQAAVSVNVQRQHEWEWQKGELGKHRSGRLEGAFGIVRKTIIHFASACPSWHSLVEALESETRRDGSEVLDVDQNKQQVTFRSKKKPIKFGTLMDYYDMAKGSSKGTTRAAEKK